MNKNKTCSLPQICPKLHKKLRIKCAESGGTMRDFVEKIIKKAV